MPLGNARLCCSAGIVAAASLRLKKINFSTPRPQTASGEDKKSFIFSRLSGSTETSGDDQSDRKLSKVSIWYGLSLVHAAAEGFGVRVGGVRQAAEGHLVGGVRVQIPDFIGDLVGDSFAVINAGCEGTCWFNSSIEGHLVGGVRMQIPDFIGDDLVSDNLVEDSFSVFDAACGGKFWFSSSLVREPELARDPDGGVDSLSLTLGGTMTVVFGGLHSCARVAREGDATSAWRTPTCVLGGVLGGSCASCISDTFFGGLSSVGHLVNCLKIVTRRFDEDRSFASACRHDIKPA